MPQSSSLFCYKLIEYLLILKHLGSFIANFLKKLLVKSKYLIRILTFQANNNAIQAFQTRYIVILIFKQTTCTIKTFFVIYKAIAANFLQLMTYIHSVVNNILANMNNLLVGFFFANSTFVLLKVRKSMPKIITTLISTNKNVL